MQCDYLFKINFRIICFWIFIASSLIFTSLILFENEGDFYWLAYGIAILLQVVLSVIFSFIIVTYFKVALSNEGIKGFNVFGRSIFIDWVNISKVKYFNFIGLKFLRVFPNDSTLALWLPLFIKNPEGFAKQSSLIPPEGNVFREFFSSKYA